MKFVLFIFLYVADPTSSVEPMVMHRVYDSRAMCEVMKETALKHELSGNIRGGAICLSEAELLLGKNS